MDTFNIVKENNQIVIKGFNENKVLTRYQPFNSFTVKSFKDEEEAKNYCKELGWQLEGEPETSSSTETSDTVSINTSGS